MYTTGDAVPFAGNDTGTDALGPVSGNPLTVGLTENAYDVAFVAVAVKVAEPPPESKLDGDATNEVTTGAGGTVMPATVTVGCAELPSVLPFRPFTLKLNLYVRADDDVFAGRPNGYDTFPDLLCTDVCGNTLTFGLPEGTENVYDDTFDAAAHNRTTPPAEPRLKLDLGEPLADDTPNNDTTGAGGAALTGAMYALIFCCITEEVEPTAPLYAGELRSTCEVVML